MAKHLPEACPDTVRCRDSVTMMVQHELNTAEPPLLTTMVAPALVPAAEQEPRTVLIIRVGTSRAALSVLPIVRIVPMAALTPIFEPPFGVVGFVPMGAELLPVIDPRVYLAQERVAPHPSQYLVAVQAATTFFLWCDQVEQVVTVPAAMISAIAVPEQSVATQLVRLDDDFLPLLNLQRFDPGPLVQADRMQGRATQ